MPRTLLSKTLAALLALLAASAALAAAIDLPAAVGAGAGIVRSDRQGLWEKTLVVRFAGPRRVISTTEGIHWARLAANHAAHPALWAQVSERFEGKDGRHGAAYIDHQRARIARSAGIRPAQLALMATAADADNLAVVTRAAGPYTVTVLATAGAKSNAQRTGTDSAASPAKSGTINIMVLTNARLSDGALARAIVTVTEGKTAALEDLGVRSTYTPAVQATGTGTDSVIVVSGDPAAAGPTLTYTGGHSLIGELIGKATHLAVIDALGRQNGFFLPGARKFDVTVRPAAKAPDSIRLALLHLDARPGEVAANRQAIEAAIRDAVANGADWLITPELAESGYNFARRIGTAWIEPFPGAWVSTLAAIARDNGIGLLVGLAERDARSGRLYNSVAVIDRHGVIQGTYRKAVVHGEPESWSVPGGGSNVFELDGVRVGVLICADAYRPEMAAQARQAGASILVSPANWPPLGDMGPKDTWERRSAETALPLVVVNRTGEEPEISFLEGESAIAVDGRRVLSLTSRQTRLFFVDWDRQRTFSPLPPAGE